MADPLEIQIADALVTALNDEDWTQDFTATREFRPIRSIKEAVDVYKVSAIPSSVGIEKANRGKFRDSLAIDIGVQHKPAAVTAALVDPVYALVIELREYFRGKIGDGTEFASCRALSLEQPELWYPEHLLDYGLLTAVLRVTFRTLV